MERVEDVLHSPEWRRPPRSSVSESTDRSGLVLSSHLPVPSQRAFSPNDSEKSRSTLLATSDVFETAADIAPWEPSIGDRLIEGIRDFLHAKYQPEPSHPAAISFGRLEVALQYAASAIQYNAKWFSDNGLAELLHSTLNAAAASTASAELFATVRLVDTVTIYSLLPSQSLQLVVRFLSQTYYAATRAHKTNKLANATWSALQNILDSHLGDQTGIALLDVVGAADEDLLASRPGYAQFAGALMIITSRLLPKDDESSTLPDIDCTQLIDALWNAVVHGTDSVRETVMEALTLLLANEVVIRHLDTQSSWDVLLETVEPCVTLTPDAPAAKALVEALIEKTDHFEPRNSPALANLAIDMNLPLTPDLATGMLPLWEEVLPTRDIPNAFLQLLTKLCRSSLYTQELDALVERSILEIFLLVPSSKSLTTFIHTIQDLATDPESTDEAANILSKALVMMFRRSVRFAGRESEQVDLFHALCHMSQRCIPAAEAMFSIRADIKGTVYVESGLLSQTFPAHSEASSMSAVMHDASALPLEHWHRAIITVLQGCVDWKIYRYFLSELPSLLGNHAMFDERIDFVKNVIIVVCDLLDNGVYPELPQDSRISKSDITVYLLQITISVLSYHRHLSKQESLGVVSTFLSIAGSRDYIVSISCIHALTICCYELPELMPSYMDDVIDKMSKLVAQRYLAIHVLLFLAGLSRQPKLFNNFQTHDFKKIFGVCGSYLRSTRGASPPSERPKERTARSIDSRGDAESADALPHYVYALAHHVIAFWYLALRAQDRLVLKEYITSFLKYSSVDGLEVVEDQGLVTIDLMDRVDATDLEREQDCHFETIDGRTLLMHRLSGVLLLTTETALRTGKTVLTVRRSTGTEAGVLQISPSDPQESRRISVTVDGGEGNFICVFPEDVSGRTYGRLYVPSPESMLGSEATLTLPDDEAVTRAIQQFDRTFALDSHKAGIIYIGDGQTTEDEILQNRMGSPDYVEFLTDLGDLMALQGATFNPQGLDRTADADGQHTIVWQNGLTELVFHITTFMPNAPAGTELSLNTANKKKHIGNDYVNIIFNNSGSPFNFDTFPSQFNFVYIVITPAARTSFIQTRRQAASPQQAKRDTFYAVQVLTRPGYPAVSSATVEKIVSGASLPQYVRNLALNECILALMWAYRDEPGEYPSSWRSRLQQIRRLWERYGS